MPFLAILSNCMCRMAGNSRRAYMARRDLRSAMTTVWSSSSMASSVSSAMKAGS